MPSLLGFPTEPVGLDAIMLAPTRELVAELNRRARDHRLETVPGPGKKCVSGMETGRVSEM